MERKAKIEHLLVIRLSAMGDVAMTVPVVESLRRAHPQLRITVLTRPFFRPFFRNIPDIEFMVFDADGRHKGLPGLVRLSGDIVKAGVDAIADLHDVLRSKVVRSMLSVRRIPVSRIDKGREERKQLTRRTQKVFKPLTPVVERYREAITRLGIDFNINPHLYHREYPMPKKILQVAGKKRGVWIGVAPFAKHEGKIYPMDLADRLIQLLAEKYQRVFVFGGGSYEKAFAEGMESKYKGVVSVIGKVSLGAEMDVIANLDAIVTMDSSSMHMASLVGTPAISVWGATHPYAGFYAWGQDPSDAVQLDLQCRPCSIYGNKPCIFGDYHCLRDITPEMIVAAVNRRLKLEKQIARDGGRKIRRPVGRPRKVVSDDDSPKRPVGRPKKTKVETLEIKRPVGRPKKEKHDEPLPKRPVGRPRKEKPEQQAEIIKRPVGRPRKVADGQVGEAPLSASSEKGLDQTPPPNPKPTSRRVDVSPAPKNGGKGKQSGTRTKKSGSENSSFAGTAGKAGSKRQKSASATYGNVGSEEMQVTGRPSTAKGRHRKAEAKKALSDETNGNARQENIPGDTPRID